MNFTRVNDLGPSNTTDSHARHASSQLPTRENSRNAKNFAGRL